MLGSVDVHAGSGAGGIALSLLSDCVRSKDGDRSVDTMIAIATKAVRAIGLRLRGPNGGAPGPVPHTEDYEGGHLYVNAPHRVDRGASDERLCAESIRWQLGTTCWSRVGRFVVVQSYGDVLFGKLDGWIDESQTEALQQVR